MSAFGWFAQRAATSGSIRGGTAWLRAPKRTRRESMLGTGTVAAASASNLRSSAIGQWYDLP